MTFPKIKDLVNGRKLSEVKTEELEEILDGLKTNKYDPEEPCERNTSQKKNRRYTINLELKKRREDIKQEANPNMQSADADPEIPDIELTEKQYLIKSLNNLSKLLNEPTYTDADFTNADENEDIENLNQLIASKTTKLMTKTEMYLPLMTNLFLVGCSAIESGSNKALTAVKQDPLMYGYTNAMKQYKDQVQECLREIFKEKPEILSYLSPEIRLGIIMLMAAGETVMNNMQNVSKFRINDGDDKDNNVQQKSAEDNNKEDNSSFIGNIISSLSTRNKPNSNNNDSDNSNVKQGLTTEDMQNTKENFIINE